MNSINLKSSIGMKTPPKTPLLNKSETLPGNFKTPRGAGVQTPPFKKHCLRPKRFVSNFISMTIETRLTIRIHSRLLWIFFFGNFSSRRHDKIERFFLYQICKSNKSPYISNHVEYRNALPTFFPYVTCSQHSGENF